MPRFRWPTAGKPQQEQPTLAALRAFVVEVSPDLDPGSRYVRELLAVIDVSANVDDYLVRLTRTPHTAVFRTDGSRVSHGDRGYSWLDDDTWSTMDVFEQTWPIWSPAKREVIVWAGDGAAISPLRRRRPGHEADGVDLCIPCSTGKEVYSLVIAGLRTGARRAGGRRGSAGGLHRPHRTGRLIPIAAIGIGPMRPIISNVPAERRWSSRTYRACGFARATYFGPTCGRAEFVDLVSSRNLLGYFRGAALKTAWTRAWQRAARRRAAAPDPFVTDSAETANVPRGLRTRPGSVRLFADASYYRAHLKRNYRIMKNRIMKNKADAKILINKIQITCLPLHDSVFFMIL